jgi:hypothetical protein
MSLLFKKPIELARMWIQGKNIGPNPERVIDRLNESELKSILIEAKIDSRERALILVRLSQFVT